MDGNRNDQNDRNRQNTPKEPSNQNGRNGQSDREKHEQIKRKLKILGVTLLIVGGIFTLIGFIDLFSSIGGTSAPTKFWCAIIGLPLLGFGAMLVLNAYRREISRYLKNESVPIVNEAGKEISPAVRDIASAVKEGLQDHSENALRCSCGEYNDKDSKFCKRCGQSLLSVCPHCGKSLAADSVFCNYCGAKLK